MSFPCKEKSAGDTFAIPIIPHGANRPGVAATRPVLRVCIRIETAARPPARCVEPKRHAPRFKILYLPYFMNDCEFNGLPQSDLAINRIYRSEERRVGTEC